jgi:uncharacterized LabA/DUF88 family protein
LPKPVAVLIDGGHLRVVVRKNRLRYDPDYIQQIAAHCIGDGEEVFRVFYYDCPPFEGEVSLPVSGNKTVLSGKDGWLRSLASKDLFAVRLGVLKFRGFKPKATPLSERPLSDQDFYPDFEQKGVDMRIGLDIANFCETKAVQRIILITNDTDCIPAMKYARRAGLQVVLMSFPGQKQAAELLHHADYLRPLQIWPEQSGQPYVA